MNPILPHSETVRQETRENLGNIFLVPVDYDRNWLNCIDRIKITSELGRTGTYCGHLSLTHLKTLSEKGYTINKFPSYTDVSWAEK